MATQDYLYPGPGSSPGLSGWVETFLAVFALGPEMILNEHRGARATPGCWLYFAIPIMGAIAVASAIFEPGYGEEMIALILCVLVAAFEHRREGWDYLRSGTHPYRHTYYQGDSILRYVSQFSPWFLKLTDDHWFCQRFLHPLVTMLAGGFIWLIGDSMIVGIYLLIGGVLIAAKNQWLYDKLVDRTLTLYDSTLSAHVMPRLLENQRRGVAYDPSIPITPALQEALGHLHTDSMTDIVERAMQGSVEVTTVEVPHDD